MYRHKSPAPLKLSLPENLVDCIMCRGTGVDVGLTEERGCFHCNAFGKIDGDAGELREAIPEHVLIPDLMKTIRYLQRNLRREALAHQALRKKHGEDIHDHDPYRGSGKYKGD